jgi:hypothetical protein
MRPPVGNEYRQPFPQHAEYGCTDFSRRLINSYNLIYSQTVIIAMADISKKHGFFTTGWNRFEILI